MIQGARVTVLNPRLRTVTRGLTPATAVLVSAARSRLASTGPAPAGRLASTSAYEARSAVLNRTAVALSLAPAGVAVPAPGTVSTKPGLSGRLVTAPGFWSLSPIPVAGRLGLARRGQQAQRQPDQPR